MANIAAKFSNIVNKINLEEVSSENYAGIFIHAYRRKRNLDLEQLANTWGMDEESLLRIECGCGTPEEIQFIFSKMRTEKK